MHILFDTGFRSTQAICVYYGYNGYPLNEARADLNFWVARITGRDAQYGLARAFLAKTYPLRYAKRPPVAFDASELVAGDLIEVRCAQSRSHTSDRFFLVEAKDSAGITLREINDSELEKHLAEREAARPANEKL